MKAPGLGPRTGRLAMDAADVDPKPKRRRLDSGSPTWRVILSYVMACRIKGLCHYASRKCLDDYLIKHDFMMDLSRTRIDEAREILGLLLGDHCPPLDDIGNKDKAKAQGLVRAALSAYLGTEVPEPIDSLFQRSARHQAMVPTPVLEELLGGEPWPPAARGFGA